MTLAPEHKHEVNARAQADPPLKLVKLEHSAWGFAVRVVENDEPVTSNGFVFDFSQAMVTLPSESDIASRGALIIDNVQSGLSELFLSVGPTIKATVQIVMASQPDNVLKEYTDLNFENLSITNRIIAGELVRENYERELWPPRVMNVQDFPGTGW